MRNDNKGHASLAELGMHEGPAPTLKDVPKLLGEKMPEVTYDRVGRMRLINAFIQRFGPQYRNLPHINNILKQFDGEVAHHNIIRRNKQR